LIHSLSPTRSSGLVGDRESIRCTVLLGPAQLQVKAVRSFAHASDRGQQRESGCDHRAQGDDEDGRSDGEAGDLPEPLSGIAWSASPPTATVSNAVQNTAMKCLRRKANRPSLSRKVVGGSGPADDLRRNQDWWAGSLAGWCTTTLVYYDNRADGDRWLARIAELGTGKET
jgi:hypothetical protein